jgi:hypothetical protein
MPQRFARWMPKLSLSQTGLRISKAAELPPTGSRNFFFTVKTRRPSQNDESILYANESGWEAIIQIRR